MVAMAVLTVGGRCLIRCMPRCELPMMLPVHDTEYGGSGAPPTQ
jgi:hypothetical protein